MLSSDQVKVIDQLKLMENPIHLSQFILEPEKLAAALQGLQDQELVALLEGRSDWVYLTEKGRQCLEEKGV